MMATQKEIERKYIEAIEAYELEILDENASVDSFINLAFLYWCCGFEYFEFSIPNDISPELMIKGGERLMHIMELGQNKFPNNLELQFWKRYFLHISYGEEFTVDDCLKLFETYKELSNIPYFFLYQYDTERFQSQKEQLISEISKENTAKIEYILSIIGA